jgi:phosphohistidine phosphatase
MKKHLIDKNKHFIDKTMKKLLIIRHAKSSWEHDVSDKDRPLSNRGINDANLVSNHLINRVKDVDFVCSSPAIRALHTCSIFMRNLELDFLKLLVSENLYDFGGLKVSNFIKSLNDDYNCVMIFGHNHAFTSISNIFGSQIIDNFPTSGYVELAFNANSWKDISTGKTELVVFPKHLKK